MVGIVRNILNGNIRLPELLSFITDYVKQTKGKEPTDKELTAITQLVTNGIFDINYAAKEWCRLNNVRLTWISTQDGAAIKYFLNDE